jgi:hypothetical protein
VNKGRIAVEAEQDVPLVVQLDYYRVISIWVREFFESHHSPNHAPGECVFLSNSERSKNKKPAPVLNLRGFELF